MDFESAYNAAIDGATKEISALRLAHNLAAHEAKCEIVELKAKCEIAELKSANIALKAESEIGLLKAEISELFSGGHSIFSQSPGVAVANIGKFEHNNSRVVKGLTFDLFGPIDSIIPRGKVYTTIILWSRPPIPSRFRLSPNNDCRRCDYSTNGKWNNVYDSCENVAVARVKTCQKVSSVKNLCKYCFWRDCEGMNPHSIAYCPEDWTEWEEWMTANKQPCDVLVSP